MSNGEKRYVTTTKEACAKDTNAPTKPYDLLYEEGGAGTT